LTGYIYDSEADVFWLLGGNGPLGPTISFFGNIIKTPSGDMCHMQYDCRPNPWPTHSMYGEMDKSTFYKYSLWRADVEGHDKIMVYCNGRSDTYMKRYMFDIVSEGIPMKYL
jgi:hypothetical protein